MQLGRRPSATCSRTQDGCGRTRTCEARRRQIYSLVRLPLRHTPESKAEGGRMNKTRDSAFCLHPSALLSLASYGSRTRSDSSTGSHAESRYTNEARLRTSKGRARESNPGHDIHSVECCHYTKLANPVRSGRGGSRTLAARFTARPRLANACDKPPFASLPIEGRRSKAEG